MNRQKKINTGIICGLMVLICAMSLGFASFSRSLNINGTATIQSASNSWNVFFSNISNSTSGEASWTTAPSISTVGTTNGSNNTVTFACLIEAPGDYCETTITVKNGGSLEAKYTSLSFSVDGTAQDTTSATLSDGSKVTITPGTKLTKANLNTSVFAKDDTETFVVKMELPEAATLPETDTTHTVTVTLGFTQNTSA